MFGGKRIREVEYALKCNASEVEKLSEALSALTEIVAESHGFDMAQLSSWSGVRKIAVKATPIKKRS